MRRILGLGMLASEGLLVAALTLMPRMQHAERQYTGLDAVGLFAMVTFGVLANIAAVTLITDELR
jgi:hypothetical protein